VRCVDCHGRVIVAVTYVQRRALVTARALDDRLAPERRLGRHWQFSWLDRGNFIHARCDVRPYVLPTDELRKRVAPASRKRRSKWVWR